MTGNNNIDQACNILLGMGPEIVVIKQSNKGSSVYTENEKHHVPAFKVKEIDPTGAGDCYCAGFITGLLKEMSLHEAARFANAVGAAKVKKLGGGCNVPTLAEVQAIIEEYNLEFKL